MARGRDWRRFQRNRTIHRKVDILRSIGGDENVKAWTGGGYIGVLSKNKIHCSLNIPLRQCTKTGQIEHRFRWD